MISKARLLRRREIDFSAWDAVVTAGSLAAPYGLSWWLEAVTDGHWYGVVLNDYQAVMPVPLSPALLRRTARLINGAAFTQHGGPFGEFTLEECGLMIDAIPDRWMLRKLAIYQAEAPVTNRKLNVTERTNHELDLNLPYRELALGYRADLRRKLRDFPAAIPQPISVANFLAFYREHTGSRFGMKEREYAAQKRLLLADQTNGNGALLQLQNDAGHTMAVVFIARQGKRLVNLMAGSSVEGFKQHAMARLLDGVIRQHAGQDLLLDFEGSDISGVATFFRGFGALPVEYVQVAGFSAFGL